jgi:hypothetical protein
VSRSYNAPIDLLIIRQIIRWILVLADLAEY